MKLRLTGMTVLITAICISTVAGNELPQITQQLSADAAPPEIELPAPLPEADSPEQAAPPHQDDVIPADDPRLTGHELEGIASWYGGKFQGRLTANGEVFDTNEMTAAHKTLPFNSIVRVINLNNNQSAEVRINDRGPFVEGRIIDLSRAGAEAIGMSGTGVAPVKVEVVHYQQESPYHILQIGAFSDPDNAEQLVIELSDAGLVPSIESTAEGIHRVHIADVHMDTLEETRRVLASLGYPDILIRKQRD
ncbi:MAG: septal ring lytic transglycosylase RlpA family protein [Spirochaeta sp.]